MAFDNDKSALVPEPPLPRPARRDAAIEAALRRFDGIEDQPSAAADRQRTTSTLSESWAKKHRPQFGMLVSASLIAVIGLPLALTAIRDRPVTPTREMASPATPESREASADDASAAVEVQGAPPSAARVAETQTMTPRPGAPPPILAERGNAFAIGEDSQLAEGVAASPPAAVVPVPAPPPPPALAEKVAQEAVEGSVVATGSRIAAPPKSSVGREKRNRGASVAAGRAAAMDATGAPDWVLQDHSYEIFLTRLQTAIRANDRIAVAQLIAFPLRVNFKGRTQLYRNARAIGRDYDRIFTPQVRRAILNQRFDQLFGRDQGVMIGNGEIWFDHSCQNAACSAPGPVRIKAVNP